MPIVRVDKVLIYWVVSNYPQELWAENLLGSASKKHPIRLRSHMWTR